MSTLRPAREISWRLVAVCCLCDGAHFYAICSLFSYAGVMTADLAWADDRDSAGFVAGLLASANMIGRMLTSSFWGLAAARYGYKWTILASFSFIALGGLSFGVCTTLEHALFARFLLLGCGNGWPTLMAPLVMEIAGAERQTEVLGIVMGCASFTQLFGPAVGGWTYMLWPRFPAAAPSLVGTSLALVVLLACMLWMPSSLGLGAKASYEVPANDGSPSKTLRASEGACGLLCRGPLPLLVAMRTLQGVLTFGLMEVIPLWAISSLALGGLQLSHREVGNFLTRSAVFSILFFTVVMPRGSVLLGPRRFAMVCCGVVAASCMMLPRSPGLVAANVLHALGTNASIAVGAMGMVFTNNAAAPEKRSEVVGHVVVFETLGKALGPSAAAYAFAASLKELGRRGHGLVFQGLAALYILYLCMVLCLPAHVDGSLGPAGQPAPPEPQPSKESVIGSLEHGPAKARPAPPRPYDPDS